MADSARKEKGSAVGGKYRNRQAANELGNRKAGGMIIVLLPVQKWASNAAGDMSKTAMWMGHHGR